MTSPPLVYENLVITGSATQEFPERGAAGDVRAWDARTGTLVWTFHTVPRPGERFAIRGQRAGAERRSGVNVWGFMTVDAERGVLYPPFAAPAWDRYGGDRHGDNLFSGSLVAADARTGRYLWHFQVVTTTSGTTTCRSAAAVRRPHRRRNRTRCRRELEERPAVLLDRRDGKPLHAIEERPTTASDVPGEAAALTQPYPVVTPPLARIAFDADDIARLTPERTQWCREWIAERKMVAGSLYEPVHLDQPTISFPGLQGGNNWGGGAYDPTTGLLYLNTSDLGQVTELRAFAGPLAYERGPTSGRFVQQTTRMPCQKPPWGQLHAIDTATGLVRWQATLGVSDNLPLDKQDTGRPNVGGPIVTAGGLVFIGATDDNRFRAFDAASGRLLWSHALQASAHATPISYRGADGRQYVSGHRDRRQLSR